jgi:hypothetical protein
VVATTTIDAVSCRYLIIVGENASGPVIREI